jgi:predicted nucleic acid-binding protein
LTTIDTSVVVRAFASWHPGHPAAVEVLASRPRLIGHVALESWSVLTRLPEPHRVSTEAATAFLAANFDEPYVVLSGDGHRALVEEATALEVTGGGIYDAAIGAAAKEAGLTLVSADRRAAPVYRAIGVDFELLP